MWLKCIVVKNKSNASCASGEQKTESKIKAKSDEMSIDCPEVVPSKNKTYPADREKIGIKPKFQGKTKTQVKT